MAGAEEERGRVGGDTCEVMGSTLWDMVTTLVFTLSKTGVIRKL